MEELNSLILGLGRKLIEMNKRVEILEQNMKKTVLQNKQMQGTDATGFNAIREDKRQQKLLHDKAGMERIGGLEETAGMEKLGGNIFSDMYNGVTGAFEDAYNAIPSSVIDTVKTVAPYVGTVASVAPLLAAGKNSTGSEPMKQYIFNNETGGFELIAGKVSNKVEKKRGRPRKDTKNRKIISLTPEQRQILNLL